MRGVVGAKKSINQSLLAKGIGLGLLCWGFKGVQQEIPSEEPSTLQIGSVASPRGQCTCPQLHSDQRLFDQEGHQHSSEPTYSPDLAPYDFCLFPKLRGIVTRQLRRWKRLWRRSLTRSHKRTSLMLSRSCGNGKTSALQPEDITSKRTSFMRVLSIKVPIRKKSGNLLMILVYIYIYIYIFIYLYIYPSHLRVVEYTNCICADT